MHGGFVPQLLGRGFRLGFGRGRRVGRRILRGLGRGILSLRQQAAAGHPCRETEREKQSR